MAETEAQKFTVYDEVIALHASGESLLATGAIIPSGGRLRRRL